MPIAAERTVVDRRLAVLTLREDVDRSTRNSINGRFGVLAEAVIELYDMSAQTKVETNQRLDRIETRLTGVETGLTEVKSEVAGVKSELTGVTAGLKDLTSTVRKLDARVEGPAQHVLQDEVKGRRRR